MIKKIFLGLGIILTLIIITAVAIPIIFEDDIKNKVEQEIDATVNADINFDIDNFKLTFFRNFPHITAEIEDVSVYNRAPFEGALLFSLERLGVEVNLYDLLFGQQMRLKGITLVRPRANIKVLKDGRANYDITYPSTDDDVIDEVVEPSAFSFQIDHWEIIDGEVTYDDKSMPFRLTLLGLNHNGKGDFNEKEFDLKTYTSLDTLSMAAYGTEYIKNKKLEADMTLRVAEEYSRFTFKENLVTLNDFALGFDGWFKMDEHNYDMDIHYEAKESTFKTLLSLVPGIYTKDFKDIKTAGNLIFSGAVDGSYNDHQMPAFNLAVEVSEGMFKYPDLPAAVENIDMVLSVDNKDGVINNTRIDLSKLHLDFAKNPFDVKMVVENLKNYPLEGTIKTKLNLEDISKIFPVEGLDMQGIFSISATAKGIYDSIQKTIPALDVVMALHNGYVKSKEFPLPLENLSFNASVKNTSGKLAETIVEVKNLAMLLDGEKFAADVVVDNLDDYTWDANASGTIDLEKITKIFPLEEMSVKGIIKADLHTKGKMSDVTKKRYDRIPTRGEATLEKFKFASEDLPYTIMIDETRLVFDPKEVILKSMTGKIGKSDFQAKGSLANYIGYFFGKNETVRGKMSLQSNLLDLNEFMADSSTDDEETEVEEESYSVIPMPKHIDVVLEAAVKKTNMMDYKLTDASGNVIIRDETASLKNLKFNLIGGAFQMDGIYNTKNQKQPKYDMKMNIKNMDIQQAFNSFSIVKKYAPIAGLAKGNFDADLKINGKLLSDMTPDMATVNGRGVVKTKRMGVTNSKIIAGITALTKLANSDEVTIQDATLAVQIHDGRLSVNPFDVQLGEYKTNVKGSVGIDGTIDYALTVYVPVNKLGGQLQGFLQQNVGNALSEIPVSIGIGGTYKKPKLTLKKEEQKQHLKKAATKVIEEKGKQLLKQAVESKEAKKIINDLLKLPSKKTDDTNKEKQESTEKLIQKGLQNLFKKKKD